MTGEPGECLTSLNGVTDVHCNDAESFLDTLCPRSKLWEGQPTDFVYRGQANAEWRLVPSANRNHREAFKRFGVILPWHPHAAVWSERADLQNELLKRFREGLERAGIAIPSPSPRVDSSELNEHGSSAAPLREAFPLMALAQHHGLPTLLLDWSRRAWIAAYFAAVDAMMSIGSSGAKCLAVWAVRRLRPTSFHEPDIFYDAPGGTNPNLQAQQGLFSFIDDEDELSLEEFLVREQIRRHIDPSLHRILLPTRLASQVLCYLAEEGITGASMFPGADGVVRAMREEAMWQSLRHSNGAA